MDNDILQEILSELKDVKTGQLRLEAELADVKEFAQDTHRVVCALEAELADVKEFAQNTAASVIIIENVWFPKIEAALEGYALNRENLINHDVRLDEVESKVAKHALEIDILKAV